jgi:hypothetical protein
MSDSICCTDKTRTVLAYFVGSLGAFLIIGAMAWLVVRQDTPAIDAAAAANRKTTRLKIESDGEAELNKYAVDPNKENLARLSIDRAMEVMVGEWGPGAAQGRAKLLERLEASKKTASFE